ncbi:LisH motif-containing protein [Plasmopara halstedii]|uniref:LisH motif-containing protein n=1 Tax=Plasmopara halstedii TaxID=4781 RepID=A0A0P1AJT4_PLAHL|nr:LisH motif-containing protein [Plasmopara halstedii]CEG41240.1 LisH motif-containing protein [Plasmopara halstedii]|eukprot:XP_024577609.1 LisH motif-containing protein [Plasmopara halstedii]
MRIQLRDNSLGNPNSIPETILSDIPANERRFRKKRRSRRRMRISKESMNRLVMNFLVGKGYREVAEAFWRDSGTKPHVDLQSVQDRMSIQQLLLKGHIQEARDKLSGMISDFFEKNSWIDFLLAKQELIELIKVHNIEEALQFAVKNLAPFGQKSPHFLQEIERTMSVIAFKSPLESPLGHLLEQTQRRRVADEVNSAILRSQKEELEPLLPSMVQHFHYMEDQLEAKLSRHPRGISIDDPPCQH